MRAKSNSSTINVNVAILWSNIRDYNFSVRFYERSKDLGTYVWKKLEESSQWKSDAFPVYTTLPRLLQAFRMHL